MISDTTNLRERCWAEIDLDALQHNFKLLQKTAATSMLIPVVKANAYGHGDIAVSRALSEAGASFFAVATLPEAMRLRRHNITQPILIFGHSQPEHANTLAQNNLHQSVFSLEYARQLSAAAVATSSHVKAHIKIDTGMGRIGFNAKDDLHAAAQQIAAAYRLPGLKPIGLFTHFSDADSSSEESLAYTREQFDILLEVKKLLEADDIFFKYTHCCNSAGLIARPEMHLDAVRPGIAIYGHPPSSQVALSALRPVASLKARIIAVKTIEKGDYISYGRTFCAPQNMTVATVSIGYADGYMRLLSSNGIIGVKGKSAKVVGRVCMDQLIADVSNIPDVKSGDYATLWNGEGADTLDKAAAKCQTINYELLCGLGRRVPRIYYKNGIPAFSCCYTDTDDIF